VSISSGASPEHVHVKSKGDGNERLSVPSPSPGPIPVPCASFDLRRLVPDHARSPQCCKPNPSLLDNAPISSVGVPGFHSYFESTGRPT